MENGRVVTSGPTDEMLERYHQKASAAAPILVHETDAAMS
jgi:hypothetical protein